VRIEKARKNKRLFFHLHALNNQNIATLTKLLKELKPGFFKTGKITQIEIRKSRKRVK